jgi:hypothetical protein
MNNNRSTNLNMGEDKNIMDLIKVLPPLLFLALIFSVASSYCPTKYFTPLSYVKPQSTVSHPRGEIASHIS